MSEKLFQVTESWIPDKDIPRFNTAFSSLCKSRISVMADVAAKLPCTSHPLRILLEHETRPGKVQSVIENMPTFCRSKKVIEELALTQELKEAGDDLHMIVFAPSDVLMKAGATFSSHDTVLEFSVFHDSPMKKLPKSPANQSLRTFQRDDDSLITLHPSGMLSGIPSTVGCQVYAYNDKLSTDQLHVFAVCALWEGQ